MKPPVSKTEKKLRAACYMTLLALAMMVYSLVHPKPLPVIVAMSFSQALGTFSLFLFLVVVAADFRRSRILDRKGPASVAQPPLSTEGPPPPPAAPSSSAGEDDKK
jgi:hypothetical protein